MDTPAVNNLDSKCNDTIKERGIDGSNFKVGKHVGVPEIVNKPVKRINHGHDGLHNVEQKDEVD